MSDEIKSTLLTLFIQYALPPLFTAVMGALVWAAGKGGAYLGAKESESKLARIGGWALHLAMGVVADLEATLRPALGQAAKDGKLTKEEMLQLRDAALKRLKELLGERGLGELQKVLGIAAPQLDAYLMGLIERAVDLLPASVQKPGVVVPLAPVGPGGLPLTPVP
jgi:hypothetical protein